MKPEPIPIPADLREAALTTMDAAKFPMLASMDGAQPRVRPVSQSGQTALSCMSLP